MTKRFRVALSFPGERRTFVRDVATALAAVLGQDKVLYDEYLQAELARPNLDVYLGKLYHDESELIVPFFCADYEIKEWCGLELRQIRDLLKQRRDDHIMPFRFDDAPIAGQLSIDGYIKVNALAPQQVANLILERLAVVTVNAGESQATNPTMTSHPPGPLYYVFASEGSARATRDGVFYSVHGEDVASALVKLFTKEYAAEAKGCVFHYRASKSIPADEQVLMMESLDWLAVYSDPDRMVYDPPPSVQTHRRAQFALRAEKWEELLRRRPATAPDDGTPTSVLPPDQRLNAGLNLLMLVAQAYYKLLESVTGNSCQTLDLDLNQSYFWAVSTIENLLSNHEDLRDFPGKFEPYFDDLYPSTILDIDWEDMVAPHADGFLSTVQRYVIKKGISQPEEGSHAAIFVALFRPSIDSCLERASEYRKRVRAHWKRTMEVVPKKESESPASESESSKSQPES